MELNINQISNKKFKFTWDDPMHTTEIEVTVPDLTKLEHSMWGDWGPMYNFELTDEQQIGIKYNDEAYFSSQKRIKINSPMMAFDREIHPFYLVIEDKNKDLKFHLFINNDYEFEKVEVIRREDRVKLFQTTEQLQFQGTL